MHGRAFIPKIGASEKSSRIRIRAHSQRTNGVRALNISRLQLFGKPSFSWIKCRAKTV